MDEQGNKTIKKKKRYQDKNGNDVVEEEVTDANGKVKIVKK